ncbi:MAG: phosphoribosylaminoimidazolesuccinocarboxamide synthase [Alphaproteobacteria bacterium]|nr:MAG: phosphoribosylaminoimidazolesuccinocarboxamide synthase [Alphaproteobacteria bacterium]TAF12641.1 MAG: phosphoribosylaminoimidazolesuccinocarboxamide synthase [Alphaproteobacteria bacterium]TAF40649.1 MAG: phosphoribosylaminoimidazolesuccinocarboxamide synthase [Alphaproteobacteria bacterium]TAF77394.1 MAG: phosphoribosylaminoimidazolesuccinocarboxamide synthase [Alphaproteobacteria bacterium]
MSSNKRTPIYEGKAKQIFEGPEPGTLIAHFKDDATAFNNQKKGQIRGKGVINNKISEYLMLRLSEIGIPNHFIRTLNMREQLIRAVEIVPLEVIVRNVAAGSFAKRFGVPEGSALRMPIVEFCLKNDELGDPFVTEDHIFSFDIADPMEVDDIRLMSMRINDFMNGLFRGVGLRLIDFKIEFGRIYDEEGRSKIILADEISPDSCRLWDVTTGEKLDKDRFRQDMGGVEEAYQEVAKRLGVLPSAHIAELDDKRVES